MVVYNTTNKVMHDIADVWQLWAKEVLIPMMMQTGLFTEAKFYNLVGHDDEEGKIFVIQYHCASMKEYDTFVKEYDEQFRIMGQRKFANSYITFRTIMEEL